LFTYKLSYVVLFPGYKVSNDDGLSMLSAVRTIVFIWWNQGFRLLPSAEDLGR